MRSRKRSNRPPPVGTALAARPSHGIRLEALGRSDAGARGRPPQHAAPDGRQCPEATGWVALVPRFFGGYRIVAPRAGRAADPWTMDDDECRAPRAVRRSRSTARSSARPLASATSSAWRSATTTATSAWSSRSASSPPRSAAHADRDGAPHRRRHRLGRHGHHRRNHRRLAVAGLSLIALDVLRAIALLRVEGKTGIATQAAILDRLISGPGAFLPAVHERRPLAAARGGRERAKADHRLGGGIVIAALFVAANAALMASYSARLTAASLGVVAAAVALSLAIGLARVRLGRRIEALDGRVGSLSFEFLTGIAKLRAAAAEGARLRQLVAALSRAPRAHLSSASSRTSRPWS
jgi:ATP-binding cassette subfamily C protein